MMKLMRAPNLMIGQHWVNVLATAGIPCELHNRYLNGALGEIPADQCAPELWLVDERDEAIARQADRRGRARAGSGRAGRGAALNAAKRSKRSSPSAGNAGRA